MCVCVCVCGGVYAQAVVFGFLVLNVCIHFVLWHLVRVKGVNCGIGSSIVNFLSPTTIQAPTFRRIFLSYQRTALGLLVSTCKCIRSAKRRVLRIPLHSLTCYVSGCMWVDPSLAQTVWTFFSCVQFEGEWYVAAFPSISCSNDVEYAALWPFFIVLAIVVCAFPLCVFARLYFLNRNGKLWSGEVNVAYGVLYEAYKPYVLGPLELLLCGCGWVLTCMRCTAQIHVRVGMRDARAPSRAVRRHTRQSPGHRSGAALHVPGTLFSAQ